MNKSNEILKCCFCGKELKENERNNPEPIQSVDKVCCNECNEHIVIPGRKYLNY